MRNIRECTVLRCTQCETLNVVHDHKIEGRLISDDQSFVYGVHCAKCEGTLEEVGPAMLQDEITSDIAVEVTVERSALDELIEDVAAVHKEIREITERMEIIKEAEKKNPPGQNN